MKLCSKGFIDRGCYADGCPWPEMLDFGSGQPGLRLRDMLDQQAELLNLRISRGGDVVLPPPGMEPMPDWTRDMPGLRQELLESDWRPRFQEPSAQDLLCLGALTFAETVFEEGLEEFDHGRIHQSAPRRRGSASACARRERQ